MSLAPELASAESAWQAEVWRLLGEVKDPEIPILTIIDLGIVRYVRGASRDALRVRRCPRDAARACLEQRLAHARGACEACRLRHRASGTGRRESQAALRRSLHRLSAL
jgi:ring-1,2-phenylacetyl-CoA epoxidase subunit PaaD